jgi:putative transposase
MSRDNPPWGVPRIHGELLKLGIAVGETSISKYLVRLRKPPLQTWRTFLDNHVKTMVSADFFTVPTIRFQVLYVFLVLAHDRRRILHFAVTAHPTAEWTSQQLREAFPGDTAPRYLLRDRDRIFGKDFVDQLKAMGIKLVLSAPRSPWQRAYVERVIGTSAASAPASLRLVGASFTRLAAPNINNAKSRFSCWLGRSVACGRRGYK